MLPLKRIVCPTDFSEPSYEALKVASELALHFSAKIFLVHVVAPIPMVQQTTVPGTFDILSYQGQLEKNAQSMLEKVLEKRVPRKLQAQALVKHGTAAEEIIAAATEQRADLIVIATHGMTGWQHLLFGSVAEKVIKHAKGPVLIVRMPGAKKGKTTKRTK